MEIAVITNYAVGLLFIKYYKVINMYIYIILYF